jgi:hypothetical protein
MLDGTSGMCLFLMLYLGFIKNTRLLAIPITAMVQTLKTRC